MCDRRPSLRPDCWRLAPSSVRPLPAWVEDNSSPVGPGAGGTSPIMFGTAGGGSTGNGFGVGAMGSAGNTESSGTTGARDRSKWLDRWDAPVLRDQPGWPARVVPPVQQARQVGAGPPASDVCFRTAPAVKRVAAATRGRRATGAGPNARARRMPRAAGCRRHSRTNPKQGRAARCLRSRCTSFVTRVRAARSRVYATTKKA